MGKVEHAFNSQNMLRDKIRKKNKCATKGNYWEI
jgi:hypothetical protein